uniref:Beta-lactamase-related domain-containing protein n=1 Tax=Chrysotila carterae TaxID=13221 RepID=A0A7S4B008_CHRCT
MLVPRRKSGLAVYLQLPVLLLLTVLGVVLLRQSGSTPPRSPSLSAADRLARLRSELQQRVSAISRYTGYAMAISFKSASGEFTVSGGAHADGGPVTEKDTFLFGSGTKPVTAVAVLQAIDRGLLSEDTPAWRSVDAGIATLGGNETLVGLFGPIAKDVTIGQLLRMQAGLADFDVPGFDAELLRRGRANTPLDFLRGAAALSPAFDCAPGTCTAYSSTNYVVLGFALLGLQNAPSVWTELDQSVGAATELERRQGHALHFLDRGPLRAKLTVRGHEDASNGDEAAFPASTDLGFNLFEVSAKFLQGLLDPAEDTEVWSQDSTVLGWTCGNGVGTTKAMANFFWKLLVEQSLLSPPLLESMQRTALLDTGWSAGAIAYGAGLMRYQVSYQKRLRDGMLAPESNPFLTPLSPQPATEHGGSNVSAQPPARRAAKPPTTGEAHLPRALHSDEWGMFIGHGGMTYGFLSEQGYIPQLNATFSAVVNHVKRDFFVPGVLTCMLVRLAALELRDETVDLECGDWYHKAQEAAVLQDAALLSDIME